jgi:hypothetical protein
MKEGELLECESTMMNGRGELLGCDAELRESAAIATCLNVNSSSNRKKISPLAMQKSSANP